ncbi:tetratricopeptide repeat protein [bacterium]|nr:tetratricopeptide repeat protein [candidate division CSSED10-310 bacterium]
MKWKIVWIVPALAIVCLSILSTRPVKADYDTAYQLYKAKKYSEAIPLLEEWCNKYPKDPRGGYTLAQCYVKTKQTNKALDRLAVVLEHHPEHAPSQFLTGFLTLGSSPDNALPHFKRATEEEADNAQYQYYYGSALIAAKQYDDALPVLKKAVELNPKSAKAQLDLGKVLLLTNRPSDAIGPLQIASKGKEDKETALYYLGVANLQTKNYADAVTALKQAGQLSPDDAKVFYNLGMAHEGTLPSPVDSVETCQPMIDAYLQAVKLEAGNAGYQFRLGAAYETAARSIYAKTAGNPGMSTQALNLLEKAKAAYATAVQADAGNPANDRIAGTDQMIENIRNPQVIEEEVQQ